MSPCGRRMYEEGQTSSVFACHAKLHIALQTPMLIIENVPDLTVLCFKIVSKKG